jgi:hypothetical protein
MERGQEINFWSIIAESISLNTLHDIDEAAQQKIKAEMREMHGEQAFREIVAKFLKYHHFLKVGVLKYLEDNKANTIVERELNDLLAHIVFSGKEIYNSVLTTPHLALRRLERNDYSHGTFDVLNNIHQFDSNGRCNTNYGGLKVGFTTMGK